MAYRIVYDKTADRFLARSNQKERVRIIEHTEKLSQNPFSSNNNLLPLRGTSRSFRLRIGKIRVIYELDIKRAVIYVVKIRYRGSAYSH